MLMTGMISEVVLHRQVEIGERLGLHPLGGVDQEQYPFAGGQGAGDLIGEIDVAGGVDEIEGVIRAVFCAGRGGRWPGF